MEQNENTLSVLKIAPGQYPQQVEMFLFVPVDKHYFPTTFTAATVVQGLP